MLVQGLCFAYHALLRHKKGTHVELIALGEKEIKAKKHFFLQQEYAAVLNELAWDPHEKKRLAQAAGGHFLSEIPPLVHKEHAFWIVPRMGTVSPWASKVQDWLRELGFSGIQMERIFRYTPKDGDPSTLAESIASLWDPLTASCFEDPAELENLFVNRPARPLLIVDVLGQGIAGLAEANQLHGWGLSSTSLEWIVDYYVGIGRNPTDAELMMYAQVNSEHCRHLIFKARWQIDGQLQPHSLMDWIRKTHERSPHHTWVAYHDNAAVISGVGLREDFSADPKTRAYVPHWEPNAFIIKVETHNHPTGIAPDPGAATGVGGEIRDEGATGSGAQSRAGLAGYVVNHFEPAGFDAPWLQRTVGDLPVSPSHFASAEDIMKEAPIGAARYGNEFGRPQLTGFFRTWTQKRHERHAWGYAKPIMLAGGIGTIRSTQLFKKDLPAGASVVVLGGPGFRIGLGGGSASSQQGGAQTAELDFASVQRANPELERRAQEVISACTRLGTDNPMLSIHDVGAGGLSNAIPELAHQSERGVRVELSAVLSGDPSLSPMEIWCNESQERYVLALHPERVKVFQAICEREKCPFAIVGEITEDRDIEVGHGVKTEMVVDLPLDFVLENEEQRQMSVMRTARDPAPIPEAWHENVARECTRYLKEVLRYPAVASKSFLITIADRTVGGLTIQDQMVGPWQQPLADCAIIADDHRGISGQAMAVGERTPMASMAPAAAARMAVGEVILNLLSAPVPQLSDIRLSGNWMADAGDPEEAWALWEGVSAVSQLCQALSIAIPVGKDSLSMRADWSHEGQTHRITSPLSFVASGFVNLPKIAGYLTPYWGKRQHDPVLLWVSLGQGAMRLGGSVLSQITGMMHGATPDLADSELMVQYHLALSAVRQQDAIWGYHDVSDGGVWACLCEMAFANQVGLAIHIPDDESAISTHEYLFSEELGVVWAIDPDQLEGVWAILDRFGLSETTWEIAHPTERLQVGIKRGNRVIADLSWDELWEEWRALSLAMARLRDNPLCLAEESTGNGSARKGLWFDVPEHAWHAEKQAGKKALKLAGKSRQHSPKAAILRSVGTNGHVEMARAFTEAGFEAVDVHLSDLQRGEADLSDFQVAAFCGGFSYGDVLGAGRAVASIILENAALKEMFSTYFHRPDTLTLGVCNGCQILSLLKDLIPGAAGFPRFHQNRSQQFEARLAMVRVAPSESVFLQGMAGWELPIVVAHGEGRVVFESGQPIIPPALVYIDDTGALADTYPLNPNGSPGGATGFCNTDGRVTLMMPHPERVFKRYQLGQLGAAGVTYSPWFHVFQNARKMFY